MEANKKKSKEKENRQEIAFLPDWYETNTVNTRQIYRQLLKSINKTMHSISLHGIFDFLPLIHELEGLPIHKRTDTFWGGFSPEESE